ncbi:LysR substrate-binding domain-containing protein [Erwinia sp.]|uniref:LysR family transcriptional regulator n=1 Tax=Erwinia citreus TaxID=558 RepID=UPI003C75401B
MQIEDLKIYLVVIASGSFTAAADQLMLSKQYVSRRMAALEESLGARLLIRNTRKLSVTDTGHTFAQHAQRILEEIEEAEQAVSERHQALHGTFRISMPMSYGMSHLSPLIADFLTHHPAVNVQIELADRYVDVIGEGFDMAIRIGALADSTLIARKLGELKRVICCSPSYLQRVTPPEEPEDLLQHACLRYGREGQTGWELNVEGKRKIMAVTGPVQSNNGEVLLDAAVAGLGLVLLPEFIVGKALERGELVRVLDDFIPSPLSLNAVFPQHRQRSEVNRVFLAFLQERIASK